MRGIRLGSKGKNGPVSLKRMQRSTPRGNCPLQLRSLLLDAVKIAGLVVAVAVSATPQSVAEELPWLVSPVPAPQAAPAVPDWLKAHVGDGDGQIAPVVLQRARALYLQKVSAGLVANPCYFAMDATRPAGTGRRFYVICEANRTFRAVPTGHGNGRNVTRRRGFLERHPLREELQQCEDSRADDRRPLCHGRDQNARSKAIIARGGRACR